jgi:hypothetical protein
VAKTARELQRRQRLERAIARQVAAIHAAGGEVTRVEVDRDGKVTTHSRPSLAMRPELAGTYKTRGSTG